MISRFRIRRVSQWLLFALLFAQAAISAAACSMPERAPAQAFALQERIPCHEEPAQNANLCLAHCLSADQSADTPQLAVPAWSGAAPLVVAVVDRCSSRAATLQYYALPRPAAPPPRILFQSLLI